MKQEAQTRDLDELGNRLRLRRLSLGVTLEQLAEALSVSMGNISSIERAVRRNAAGRPSIPGRELLRKWADQLHFKPEDTRTILKLAGYEPSALMASDASPDGSTIHALPSNLIEFLVQAYGPAARTNGGYIVQMGQASYPAAFFPAQGLIRPHEVLPEKLVEARWLIEIEDLVVNDPQQRMAHGRKRYPDELDEEINTRTGSGNVLAMRRLESSNPGPIVTAQIATYGMSQDSCETLKNELLEAFRSGAPARLSPSQRKRLLPYREKIHSHSEKRKTSPLLDGDGRAAAIGVSCLVVVTDPDSNEPIALTHQRSDNVGTYQRFFHVFPAGMLGWRYSPLALPDGTEEQKWGSYLAGDVELAVLEEFVEELFSDPTATSATRQTLRAHPQIDILRRYNATLTYLGVAVDLLNLRPDICFMLKIDDSDWLTTTRLRPNWEYLETDFARIRKLPLDKIDLARRALDPRETVPVAAACYDVVARMRGNPEFEVRATPILGNI
jgi:transcriptional regulator with XRE-family HTH domain